MEDILEVYKRPYDPKRPVVCMDEQPIQLVKETRTPSPAEPGKLARYDYEYERNGTAVSFMFSEPLGNWRKANIREHKTKRDWAEEIRELVDVDYGGAEKIVLVMDNLNTHTPGALYERFSAEEARRILDRLEMHYTPKHGSWLNMAEIELSVFTRQCLGSRMPDFETLKAAALAWYKARNACSRRIDWQFTTSDARVKLKRLYPVDRS